MVCLAGPSTVVQLVFQDSQLLKRFAHLLGDGWRAVTGLYLRQSPSMTHPSCFNFKK